MDLAIFVQLLIGGIAMGIIYGLIGFGINLIFNATSGVNFAQGALVMLGAYMSVTFTNFIKLPLILSAICAVAVMAVIGALFGFFVYEPVRAEKSHRFLLAAVAVSIFLTEVIQLIWGKLPYVVPRFIKKSSVRAGTLVFDTQNLCIIGVAVVCLFLIHLLLNKTQLGLMMRAVGQSKEVSSLMGIPVRWIVRITFACSTMMATVAGVVAGPIFFVSPLLADLSVKGFASGIIGGFGPRVFATIIGGIILGLVETFGAFFLSSSYRDAWGFIFLICMLLISPYGLVGEKRAQKV